jgi:hypothetical protein
LVACSFDMTLGQYQVSKTRQGAWVDTYDTKVFWRCHTGSDPSPMATLSMVNRQLTRTMSL